MIHFYYSKQQCCLQAYNLNGKQFMIILHALFNDNSHKQRKGCGFMSKFTATFYGGEEVMYSGSDNSTRWYKKDLGTTLLSILNTDVDDIENIVKSYPGKTLIN